MKIVISSGHGKKIRGAAGSPIPPYADEVDEARKVVEQVAKELRARGVGTTVFHDNTSTTQQQNLNTIIAAHNSNPPHDWDISIHFNAYQQGSKPMGTECLYLTQSAMAGAVSKAIADAGHLINRGAKKRTDLAFLNGTLAPALLAEIAFCDSSADVSLYRQHFNAICGAIATAVSGQAKPPIAPDVPPPDVPPPDVPPPVSTGAQRPTLSKGSYGDQVRVVQQCLMTPAEVDGDFGSKTDTAVRDYQTNAHLTADGIVGYPQTWPALERDFDLPPYEPPVWALTTEEQATIVDIARQSEIFNYSWPDRGTAPPGYTQGFALAFAVCCKKLALDQSSAMEMAKADTRNDDKDVLSWYRSDMTSMGWDCSAAGGDTLRYLFALLMGLGMRESSGKYCEGRDQSATNTTSDTAEAGLYQMSWNAEACSDEMSKLFDLYSGGEEQSFIEFFEEGVSCGSSSWASYGSGEGLQYQELAKHCPPFAVETTAIGLRNLRQHWGPINRKEVMLSADAERMLRFVQIYIERTPAVA